MLLYIKGGFWPARGPVLEVSLQGSRGSLRVVRVREKWVHISSLLHAN